MAERGLRNGCIHLSVLSITFIHSWRNKYTHHKGWIAFVLPEPFRVNDGWNCRWKRPSRQQIYTWWCECWSLPPHCCFSREMASAFGRDRKSEGAVNREYKYIYIINENKMHTINYHLIHHSVKWEANHTNWIWNEFKYLKRRLNWIDWFAILFSEINFGDGKKGRQINGCNELLPHATSFNFDLWTTLNWLSSSNYY